jgi:hypothetical protein
MKGVKKESFKVNMPFYEGKYYQELLTRFCSSEFKEMKPKDIRDKVSKCLGGIHFQVGLPTLSDESLNIYRVTDNEPPNGEEHLPKHYSYSPMANASRCNYKGQKVFYGANSPDGAFKEKNVEIGKSYYLSKWKIKPSASKIVYLGFGENVGGFLSEFNEHLYESIRKTFSKLPNEFHKGLLKKNDFLNEIFTINNEYYHISAALCFDFMNNENDCFLLAYPSIAKNKNDINFALSAKFADDKDFLELDSVIKITVTEFSNGGTFFNPKKRALFIDGRLEWSDLSMRLLGINTSCLRVNVMNKWIDVNPDDIQDVVTGKLLRTVVEEWYEKFEGSIEFPENHRFKNDLLDRRKFMCLLHSIIPMDQIEISNFEYADNSIDSIMINLIFEEIWNV